MSLLLAPLGWLYGGLMQLRRFLYRKGALASQQLPGLVLSVGNLEAGGTGKSPVVMALAKHLRERGAHPAILTRGYRSGLGSEDSAVLLGAELLLPPLSAQSFHADEAMMQAQTLREVPVIIGARRWAAAQRFLRHHPAPTHWILDDGFQHLGLKRQLDIVLLDAENPFHNGRCLPAGRLREFAGTLKFAQLIFLTRAGPGTTPFILQNLSAPVIPIGFANSLPRQVAGLERPWSSHSAALLALGIAHPDRILEHCRQQHYPITEPLIVADHELFPKETLEKMGRKSGAILTTEKDFWRQPEVFRKLHVPIYVLPLELRFPELFDLSKVLP